MLFRSTLLSLLHYVGNCVNASEEVIGYVQHPHSSKMHKQPDVVGVKTGEPSFTNKIFHYNLHHRCISIK